MLGWDGGDRTKTKKPYEMWKVRLSYISYGLPPLSSNLEVIFQYRNDCPLTAIFRGGEGCSSVQTVAFRPKSPIYVFRQPSKNVDVQQNDPHRGSFCYPTFYGTKEESEKHTTPRRGGVVCFSLDDLVPWNGGCTVVSKRLASPTS